MTRSDGLRRMRVAFGICLLFFARSALADCGIDSRLQAVVEGALHAGHRVSHDGTLLFEYNEFREFVKVSSEAETGVAELQRLNYHPVSMGRSYNVSGAINKSACDLAKLYFLSGERGQIVAGRETIRIVIRPRDMLRFGYVIDVDDSTHLPLRIATLSPDGQILERAEFADIVIGDSRSQDTEFRFTGVASRLTFASLPPGFDIIENAAESANAIVVSDGLAAVSVVVEGVSPPPPEGEGAVLKGSTVSYTRGVSGSAGVLITVIGEVPLSTARLLADAVRIEGGTDSDAR
jgi:hypothetical protein